MCGRFTRKENFQRMAEQLGLKVLPPLRSRYNIAPSQLVACVRTNPESKERECTELKWGLVPSWAKDLSIGNKLINARGETVAEKPAFRKAFKSGSGKGKPNSPITFASRMAGLLPLPDYGNGGRNRNQP
jgi:putative SOS response-associated peptidase YedK